MKINFFIILITLLLNACSTRQFIRYEKGELITAKTNLKKTKLPTEYNVTFRKKIKFGKNKSGHKQLEIMIVRNNPVMEEWEDVYSKIGIYKIPFMSYKFQTIETREHEKGTIVNPVFQIISNNTSIHSDSIQLTINASTATDLPLNPRTLF